MTIGLPTALTLMRLLLIPVFVVCFYLPYESARIFSAAIFVVAAVTDWLDGYFARRLKQTSRFGAFLDPVADKLMVSVALVLLVQDSQSMWMALPAAIIISREIIVSALREWMAEIGKRTTVAVSSIGKFKTVAQILALIFLIYAEPLWGIPTNVIGYTLLYVAVVLTIWSMIAYLKAAMADIFTKDALSNPDNDK